MTASDLETRVRTYLNEAAADFYTQAEIWRWISVAARDISQKTLCVRRILTSATGGNNVRGVALNAYKCLNVEYVTTRPVMLPVIDPLKLGYYPKKGTAPQYWYESGNEIGIEPVPDGIYSLRLYVADVAKLTSDPVWATDWTNAGGWTLGDNAIHAGASSTLTLTAGITSATNYTLEFEITGIGTTGTFKITAGSVEGTTVTTNGWHTQSLISDGTTLTLTGVQDVTVDNLTILKEGNIAATTDEYELPAEWDASLCLYATYSGLLKNKKYQEASLLANIYNNEFEYLRQNIAEVIPDGRTDMVYR